MSKPWLKTGKWIIQAGKLIWCDTCPCAVTCCFCGEDHLGHKCCYSSNSVITLTVGSLTSEDALTTPEWRGFLATLAGSYTLDFTVCTGNVCGDVEAGSPEWRSEPGTPFVVHDSTEDVDFTYRVQFIASRDCCANDGSGIRTTDGVSVFINIQFQDPITLDWIDNIIGPLGALTFSGCGDGSNTWTNVNTTMINPDDDSIGFGHTNGTYSWTLENHCCFDVTCISGTSDSGGLCE